MARASRMWALNLSNGGVFGVIHSDTPEVKPLETDVLGNKKTVISSQTKLSPQGPCYSSHDAPHSSPLVVIACLRSVFPRRVGPGNPFSLRMPNTQQSYWYRKRHAIVICWMTEKIDLSHRWNGRLNEWTTDQMAEQLSDWLNEWMNEWLLWSSELNWVIWKYTFLAWQKMRLLNTEFLIWNDSIFGGNITVFQHHTVQFFPP